MDQEHFILMASDEEDFSPTAAPPVSPQRRSTTIVPPSLTRTPAELRARRTPPPATTPATPASTTTSRRTRTSRHSTSCPYSSTRHRSPPPPPSNRSVVSPTPAISDWTVAGLQKALRAKNILFSRAAPKATLFSLYRSALLTSSSPPGPSRRNDVRPRGAQEVPTDPAPPAPVKAK